MQDFVLTAIRPLGLLCLDAMRPQAKTLVGDGSDIFLRFDFFNVCVATVRDPYSTLFVVVSMWLLYPTQSLQIVSVLFHHQLFASIKLACCTAG